MNKLFLAFVLLSSTGVATASIGGEDTHFTPRDLQTIVTAPSEMPTAGECIQDPSACDDGSCGDCLTDHGGTGCSCERCECAVCTKDPFCCDTVWDSYCAGSAADLCDCDVPPTSSPQPSASPLPSSEPSVSPAPSVTAQPSYGACDLNNTACADGTCGDCYYMHGGSGCSCPGCECVVCRNDPYCCINNWDLPCVDFANNNCECEIAA